MSDRLPDGSEPAAKRRKVRKGTRSCWECRRRKIKCHFGSQDDVICIGCKQRGTICRSQEFDDDNAPEPGQKSDPPLARRLDRLEQMMERIVDRIVPDEMAAASGPVSSQTDHARRSLSPSSHDMPIPGRREASVDVLETSATSEGPIAALLAMRHEPSHRRGASEPGHMPTPAMTVAGSSTPSFPPSATTQGVVSRPPTRTGAQLLPPLNQNYWVCTSVRGAFPPQLAIKAIVSASPGASYAAAMCYSDAQRLAGKAEAAASLVYIPIGNVHALLLAKRALQILICIQQLPPSFDWEALAVGAPMKETMSRLLNAATLVTSNDELMGYAEGIECLILQATYQANCGNLRRAWVTVRRALGLAQMMGLDKNRLGAFRSCDPKANPVHRTSAPVLWLKVVSWDRSLSLLLGLSAGSQGNQYGSDEAAKSDTAMDRLEKAHSAISARISERNDNHQQDPTRHPSIYALTQDIDLELEAASSTMPLGWWDCPRTGLLTSQTSLWEATARSMAQIHHFTLVMLLHVPYMLRDLASPRYDYSKTSCVAAARDLLTRFASFRAHNTSAYSCRRVDYAGLIASMTLCLAYLSKRRTESWEKSRVQEDSELVEMARRRMDHVAHVNGDRLSREAVGIIGQLTPIIDKAIVSLEKSPQAPIPTEIRDMRFDVPCLGTVNIQIAGSLSSSATDRHGHRRHPSSATGAFEKMALSHAPHIPGPPEPFKSPLDAGFLEVVPYNEQLPFGVEEVGFSSQFDFMAGAEDWALQGVDAAYWSLFEGSL
ncbi:hypothetical protein BD289DRAFT_221325 [Coniella lustricola]|uniref:Zn(2)-C6 fungal-type domain-containing protein n=1 Tax=Coniella lustricola TaxID=2025994 RepID=A0A2T3AAZ8_9PEZI|nr:hypothetical protein BD289DRAFT_221325 [Coniella lustricola]